MTRVSLRKKVCADENIEGGPSKSLCTLPGSEGNHSWRSVLVCFDQTEGSIVLGDIC